MSLITRCPACGTMFKVVPDQLRISDGWVRCGQCAEVFEAPEHLQQEPAAAAVPAPPAPDSGHADADVRGGELPPAGSREASGEGPGDGSDHSEGAPEGAAVDAPSVAPGPLPEGSAAAPVSAPHDHEESWSVPPGTEAPPPDGQLVLGPQESDDAGDEGVRSTPQETPSEVALNELAAAPVSDFLTEPSAAPSLEPSLVPDSSVPEVSFVREAQRKALWQRPRVRRLLMVACAVLLVSLSLQAVLHERDRIAALQPRGLGLLQALCAPLRCAVKPLRQIESIVIDSSSFRRVRDNVYQLNLGIKNAAPVALAMPSVELALTDTQDQPVLRRVLSPAELGAAAVLAARGDWSGSLAVSVTDSSIAARIAGYRVLAFYP